MGGGADQQDHWIAEGGEGERESRRRGTPGEVSARDGQARGEGGAQERRALLGNHDRGRGQLELPALEYHLHRQGPLFLTLLPL